ncbi:hypothetical protein ACHAPT_005418 [Fusarium lateritium]
MAESTSIPLIICGKTESVAIGIAEALKPEFEVVQFVRPGESGLVIIPPILTGHPPPPHPDSSSVGTGNYAHVLRAILLGGFFDDAAIEPLREAARAVPGARRVPWLRQDHSKPAPPIDSPEYPKALVQRSKNVLLGLEKEGKLDGTHDELEWY